jgi:hypothetical protein
MSVRRTLAAALAAGVLLAGCSDDPEPTFEPPASPSPSESESSSAEPEAQSPEEFIREWFALAVAMQNTGNTSDFLKLASGCDGCQNLADRVEEIYAAGGKVRIKEMEVRSVKKLPGRAYSVVVRASATKVQPKVGGETQTLAANTNEYRMFIRQDGTSWTMTDYFDTPS